MENNPERDIEGMENQIDLLVYHLYNLDYDEILIVDNQTKIKEDEYNSFRNKF